ncbi:MAG TPA: putative lipid II flippase FtsW [Actinophytocola sp.]|jgi:cell division protein FtsW|nr:putative lipid II flippase FtsW [Actinophytocola sp.]
MTALEPAKTNSEADKPATRKSRKKERKGGRIAATRTALTAWLGRPLASFHVVLAICALLIVLGLVMVLSASSVISLIQDASAYTVFGKQVVFVLAGLVLFWIGLRVPLTRIRAASPVLLWVSVLMLVLVLIPGLGARINGTRSWFVIGPVGFQPVEVAKLALALWGAHILVVKRGLLHQYRHLLVPVVPAALVMFALVMLQPDLGGTVTLGVVLVALLWFAGAQLRLFGALALGGLAGVVVLAIGTDYRLSRVLSFLSPEKDPSGAAYQANQALYALADGGLFGKGLGQGPSKWQYLPNVHNDFIFALIGEELGFVGCALVLGLFGMLAVVGMRVATRNIDPWIRLVAATLTVWLVAQAAINIGYVVNLLPVTGITLPLISSGGTSVVITLLVFGLLANCARHEPEAVAALRSQGPGRFGRLMRLPAPEPYQPPAKRRPVRAPAPSRGPGGTDRARRRYPRSSRGGTS